MKIFKASYLYEIRKTNICKLKYLQTKFYHPDKLAR